MKAVDWKFRIDATALHNGKAYSELDSVLFLCKDVAVGPMLRFYRQECVRLGCAANQIEAIDLLIDRVAAWQRANPGLLKIADIEGNEALIEPYGSPGRRARIRARHGRA